jgi:hypothetical protein
MIGIFWLKPDSTDFFYSTVDSPEQGEPYGDWIVAVDDHWKKWDELEAAGKLNSLPEFLRDEYFRLPRGRVSYQTKEKKYYVYHGNWFRQKHKAMFYEHYHIAPEETAFVPDEHYMI